MSAEFPLSRWVRHAASSEPAASGYVVLAGNSTAHAEVLMCQLRLEASAGNEVRHLLEGEAWEEFSCVDGCPTLLDDVSAAVERRDGRWGVLHVHAAERAPVAQISVLATRFFHAARCTYATAQSRISADCRRLLFVLSTPWGGDAIGQPGARARPRHKLHANALIEASAWLSAPSIPMAMRARLRASLGVVLGVAPSDAFALLIAEQEAVRAERRAARASIASSGGARMVSRDGGPRAHQPDLSVFERVAGQHEVVREVRARLGGIASGADGGEDAHVFYFYGFPGTGKTMLAELVAVAQHGVASPPHYQRFSMQNYKTDEDMWKLVSPPCGVKGEGAFASLFARRVGCDQQPHGPRSGAEKAPPADAERCDGPAPVVLFDEIEEARADFMTSALVNAIDHKGFVEYTRKLEHGGCATEHARTAGAFIILTSNCFMEELASTLSAESTPGRPVAEVYRAVRRAMDIKIFDEGIPCDRHGTPSPFGARKMRDRMRGNVYPFFPLADDEMVAAFERQLHERAEGYQNSRGVGLYWTREYARLIIERAGVAAGAPRAHTAWGGEGAGSNAVGHGDEPFQNGAARPPSRSVSEAPSLRKLIEQLMRLDERSVERLYAEAAEACTRGRGRLHTLVLHLSDGLPAASQTCASDEADGRQCWEPQCKSGYMPDGQECFRVSGQLPLGCDVYKPHNAIEKDPASVPPMDASLPSTMPSGAHASVAGGGAGGGGSSRTASGPLDAADGGASCADVDMDVVTDTAADTATDTERIRAVTVAHAAEIAAAKQREAALANQVEQLHATVADLQTALRTWQLVAVVLAVVAAVAVLGAAHAAIAYTLFTLKLAATATATAATIALAAYAVLAALCHGGVSERACTLQALLLDAARWTWWALAWAWELAWRAFGGGWPALLAIASVLAYLAAAIRHTRRREARDRDATQAAIRAATGALETTHAEQRATERAEAAVTLLAVLSELGVVEGAAAAATISTARPEAATTMTKTSSPCTVDLAHPPDADRVPRPPLRLGVE